MRVVLLGPPGCGKGTQAALLRERLGVPHLSTGDMLRAAVEAGTEIGRRAGEIMKRGGLVPDEAVVGIVAQRIGLRDCGGGFVLDGFPRTVAQAEALGGMLEERGLRLDRVIEIAIDEGGLVRRVTGRFVCAGCNAVYNEHSKPPQREGICDKCGGTEFRRRPDDTAEAVAQRLAAYREETAPLVPYYRDRGLLAQVDGGAPLEEVSAAVEGLVS